MFIWQVVMLVHVSICYADSTVEFIAQKNEYNIGDLVMLNCYIRKANWLTATFLRNGVEIAWCTSPSSSCGRAVASQSNYEYSIIERIPTVTIINVTNDDSGVNFECKWIQFEDTVSFQVNNKSATDEMPVLKHLANAVKPIANDAARNDSVTRMVTKAPVNSDVTTYSSIILVGLCHVMFVGLL